MCGSSIFFSAPSSRYYANRPMFHTVSVRVCNRYLLAMILQDSTGAALFNVVCPTCTTGAPIISKNRTFLTTFRQTDAVYLWHSFACWAMCPFCTLALSAAISFRLRSSTFSMSTEDATNDTQPAQIRKKQNEPPNSKRNPPHEPKQSHIVKPRI